MTALRRDMIDAVEKTLRSHGVEEWSIDHTSGHLKYRFVFNGVDRLFVTAGSPSDRRALLNAITDLRHYIGVKRAVHKNPKNRAKPYKKYHEPLPKMPTVTIGKDFWGVLTTIKVEPHYKPLGISSFNIDAAARSLADAIMGKA